MVSKSVLKTAVALLVCVAGVMLFSACKTTNQAKLPNEPRKFKIGEEVPESFEFFRPDEEIRGRLLSGIWKSREVKYISYKETALSTNNFKVSRINSPLQKITFTFIFSEDGSFTGTKTWQHTYASENLSGHWHVKNGALCLLFSGATPIRWEYHSVRFLDDKTIELLREDLEGYMQQVVADSKILTEKKGLRVLSMSGNKFRDKNGNRYLTFKYETEWENGYSFARRKERTIEKFSAYILERQ